MTSRKSQDTHDFLRAKKARMAFEKPEEQARKSQDTHDFLYEKPGWRSKEQKPGHP
jgi:hypothetical protein